MNDTILNCLMAINLDVNIWTARRKLTPADFGGADLPPEELASLGSKRICDPEELKIFGTLKARAVNLLDRHGVRFLGGWGVPEEKAPVLVEELDRIRAEFLAARDTFLTRYDDAVRDWIARHGEWERIIADSTVSADYVRSRMGFRWQVYRIVPPAQSDVEPVAQGLAEEVRGLGRTLFDEVAKAATEAWHKCYAGRSEVTHKALSPLRTIHQKLAGLTFVEPRVAPVADLIGTAFANLPKRGMIQGAHLLMLQGLVALLRDPSALMEHGQRIMEGHRPSDLLDALLRQDGDTGNGRIASADEPEEGEDDMPDLGDDRALDAIPREVMPDPQPVLPNCGLW
ncbi:DUF3150 domain-containing protein [Nitratidesulfovibrio termitidis]|uniref:DUF3150 domain-containing protein n=1 Tax=Nitratidesulfovibrio termitidis TaxID=42252 RepID=UPI000421EBDD|nr:DUF3150 domain-containing protein [Nitratidesulfovibrio termitidis]